MKSFNFVILITAAFMVVACSDSTEVVPDQAAMPDSSNLSASPSNSQPNVLFILVDDMGFNDVGYNGSEIATPNLDELAATGVQLDRNYVYPICSPTRTALLTGHNPLDYGVDGPMGDHTGVPLELKLMPEYFKDMGYQTYMVGKWHLGIGNTDFWPTSRGFDYHYGFLGGWIDFYTHVYHQALDWQRNGQTLREEGHATDLLTEDAIRVIAGRDSESPFFMYLTYNAPHSPLQFTPVNSGLNSDVEAGDRRVYAEMVTQVDAAIGEVIASLDAEGILQDTIIVFSSDNGGALDQGASNGDLRMGKGQSYEGGMRVPGSIWWPGQVEGGILEQPIAVHDWLPTLLEAAGGDPADAIDPYGQSMWGAIARGEQIDRALTTIGVGNSRASFDWPLKVVRHGQGDLQQIGLFNVLDDPTETNDLSESNPEKLAELLALIEAIPSVPSKGVLPGGKRPGEYFGNTDGDGWNYDIRLPEVDEPWAETAVRGSN